MTGSESLLTESAMLPERLPTAGPTPCLRGVLRSSVEDFRVDEVLPFEPDGSGEHLMIRVRKRGTNTDWLARRIARLAGVRPVDVGYAGLKDRHAVTSQWFSLWLGSKPEPDLAQLADGNVQILETVRHGRKLRRGALQENRFRLTLRGLQGDRESAVTALERIAAKGVPNYFGEQRFGRGGANLEQAERLFGGARIRDRALRGMLLSAARSQLFNQVLARRVDDGSWDTGMPGDAMVLDRRRSLFAAPGIDETLRARLVKMEIHPSGPLWGRGDMMVTGTAAELEQNVLAGWQGWRAGLERAGLDAERRALRCRVADLRWDLHEDSLSVEFALGPGSYATAVLREFIDYRNAMDAADEN